MGDGLPGLSTRWSDGGSSVFDWRGGGTLISFPVLIGLGMPPLVANATNAVGLWPGSIGGGLGFLPALGESKRWILRLSVPAAIGGTVGAGLLLLTPARLFDWIVPLLILAASLLLLAQGRIRAWTQRPHVHLPEWTGLAIQLGVGIYGGYFGAGMGLMMLAGYSLFMTASIHEMNAVKTWVGMFINLVASILLLWKGYVLIVPGLILAAGALAGGYVTAKASLRSEPEKLRLGIAVYGLAMTAYFFWRAVSQG
jgi:uncharacterized protein